MNNKYVFPSVLMCFLGVFYASLPHIVANVGEKTISATSLAISITAVSMTTYFTVETALELRNYNKKKLFSDYCARFSTDTTIFKVAEWLLAIAELDSNDDNIWVYSKNVRDNKVVEPTRFEKERFYMFLTELNIQIENGQIERDDARKVFSLYAHLFNNVRKTHTNTLYYEIENNDFAELL